MTDLIVIENKISAIQKYLGILKRYQQYSQQEIVNDIDKKGALERYLYLAIQATIDLAEAIISYRKLRKPSTMSESFHILREEAIIPDEITEQMVKMSGFCNIVAHDYETLDYDIVYDILQNRLRSIETFLNVASRI